jgi:hypothetical protein
LLGTREGGRDVTCGSFSADLEDFTCDRSTSASSNPIAVNSDLAGVHAPSQLDDVTLVTPVCAAFFTALRDAIINGDACALDVVNKQKLDGHIGKLAKAAQISYARTTIQEDRIRSLLKINDEAKPRRSTRPIILSTAKMISYEDLEAALAKRAEQEAKAVARKKKAADARAKRAEQEENGKVTKSRKQTPKLSRGVESDHRGRAILMRRLRRYARAASRMRASMQIRQPRPTALRFRWHHAQEGHRLRRCGEGRVVGEIIVH